MGRIKLAASGGVREALAASLSTDVAAAQGRVTSVSGLLPAAAASADSGAGRRDI